MKRIAIVLGLLLPSLSLAQNISVLDIAKRSSGAIVAIESISEIDVGEMGQMMGLTERPQMGL